MAILDHRTRAIIAAAFFLCQMCGNDRTKSPKGVNSSIKIGAVQWRVASDNEFDAPSREEFTKAVERAMANLPAVTKMRPRGSLKVEGVLNVVQHSGNLMLKCSVRMHQLSAPLTAGIAATGLADSTRNTELLIDNGLGDLKKALVDLIELVNAEPANWIKSLNAVEPDEQILAAQLLGHYKVRSAVTELGRLLSDTRQPVQEAASEALAEIGDETAVPLLIQSVARGDLRSEVRAIEAMGKIGGAEAKAYLEMTAYGHEVPEVRRLSLSLLKRLSRNEIK